MKIKCVKIQCPKYGNASSCQISLNRQSRICCARVRNCSHRQENP